MNIRREIGLYIVLGIVFSIVATFPLFQHSTYISNHGDINRALIFAGTARQAILSGRLPVWNPYFCGGGPMLGDVESWFLQPFFLLTLPFGELLGLKISYALTLATAFIGFAFLGRKVLRLGTVGSLVFALLLAFGGYISQHLAEGYYVWVSSAWIPWFLLFGIHSLSRPRYIPIAGLMLAFMFGGGSMHMVVYSFLFLVLLLVFQKFDYSWKKRILVLGGIGVFFVLLSAIKLFPALTLIATDASRPGFTLPITFLPKMLLGRGLVPPVLYRGTLYRFGEFGNYVGYGAVLVACIPLLFQREGVWKKYRGFFLASLITLVLVFTTLPPTHGYISRVTDLFRIPSRLMIFPMISFALLAGYAMKIVDLKKKLPLLSLLFFSVLAGDLLSNDMTLFSRMFQLPLPEIFVEDTFMRVVDGYTTKDEKYYRAGYVDFLENRGINGLCRFYQPKPSTSARNSIDPLNPDRGEVYLENKEAGSVEVVSRNTNQVTVDVNTVKPATVFLNMNYYPGWKTKEGLLVENKNGLISATVPEGKYMITFQYYPIAVRWGLWVFGAGMLISTIFVVWARYRNT